MEGEGFCFICDFCKIENPNIPYLQRILTNPQRDKDNDNTFGYLERLIKYEIGIFMPNFLTNHIRYSLLENDYVLMFVKIYFFVLLGEQESLQHVIRQQLIRSKQTEMLEFFDEVFVKFVKSATKAMLHQSFEKSNISDIFRIYIAQLQTTWLTQSYGLWSMQFKYDELAKKEIRDVTKNSKMVKQAKRESEKAAPKTPARRKRRKLNTILQNEKKKATMAIRRQG